MKLYNAGKNVAGEFDLRGQGRQMTKMPTYDNCFILNKAPAAAVWPPPAQLAMRAHSATTGITLDVLTDQPCTQIYGW